MRSYIWKTHEICEGSISSTLRIRNSKKSSRMPVRSWNHQLLLLCPVKFWKIVGVMHPTKFRRNLRVFWKTDESTRLRLGKSIPHHHEDHIARKRWKFITALQFGSQIYSCAPSYEKFLQQKQRWTRNGKNWRKFRRGTWEKSEVRNKWSMKEGRRAQKFILHH